MLEPQDGVGEAGGGVLKLGREKAVVCGWKGKRTLCVHQAPAGARTGQSSVGLGQDQCVCVEGCERVLLAGEAGRSWVTGITGAVPQLGLGAHSLLSSDQKAKLGSATRPSGSNF